MRRQATEFSLEGASALNVKRLVDRLVADPHGLIMWEIDLEAVRYLLGAPCTHPAAILSMRLAPALPGSRRGPLNRSPVRSADLTRQPLLHVVAQLLVGEELRSLGALSHELGLPLGNRCPILELPASGRSVAAQLPRDRRRSASKLSDDLSDTCALRLQQRDLLSFMKGQVSARGRRQIDRHAATMSEPASTHQPERHPLPSRQRRL